MKAMEFKGVVKGWAPNCFIQCEPEYVRATDAWNLVVTFRSREDAPLVVFEERVGEFPSPVLLAKIRLLLQ